MANTEHECYEPASERDLDADVAEEEEGTDPGYGILERLFCAGVARVGLGYWIFCAVEGAG